MGHSACHSSATTYECSVNVMQALYTVCASNDRVISGMTISYTYYNIKKEGQALNLSRKMCEINRLMFTNYITLY
uniref:Uncharacterized protein n=1 Tax=Staphylococcus phage HS12 TaxID=3056402 RepID=A0AA49X2P5_9VIRU|nr:MAG: hypothetical protein [Staphylococcus phage HS12]